MAKRSATTELNYDNWCDEEEPETAGVFKRASDEDIKKRQIRTAKRRGVPQTLGDSSNATTEQAGTKSVFAGFSGFGAFKKSEPTSSKAVFSFLSATPNGSDSKPSSGPKVAEETASSSGVASEKKPLNGLDTLSDSSGKLNDKEYFRKLKGLNESVAKWISTHVASNPLIILTPVFRDYERHLSNIQDKGDAKTSETISAFNESKQTEDNTQKSSSEVLSQISSSGVTEKADITSSNEEKKTLPCHSFGSSSSTTSTASATFSFGSSNTVGQTQQQFCFGSPSSSTTSSNTPSFSFGAGGTSSPSAGFSFGAGKPFTFSNVASTNKDEKKEEEEDDAEEDAPPKPDHKPVSEDGATYTKRCKVFVKQGTEYSDHGVGNLFLKPVDGGKTQLIVRADTSLGNVLMNILIGSSLPVQRIGRNNVAVVCLPTPESDPPPVTVLLRVKTGDDAEELFNTIEKHKKEVS